MGHKKRQLKREVQKLQQKLRDANAIETELRTRVSQPEPAQVAPSHPQINPPGDDLVTKIIELENQIEAKDLEIALFASQLNLSDDPSRAIWFSLNGALTFSRLETDPFESISWRLEITEPHPSIPGVLLTMSRGDFNQLTSLPDLIILSFQLPFDALLIVHLTSTQMMCWDPRDSSHQLQDCILPGGFENSQRLFVPPPEPLQPSFAETSSFRFWFRWKGSTLRAPHETVTFRRKLRQPQGQPRWKSLSDSPRFRDRWLACFEKSNAVFLQSESNQTIFILLTMSEGYLFQHWFDPQLIIDSNPLFSGHFKSITPSLNIPTEISTDDRGSLILQLEDYANLASVGMVAQQLKLHLPDHVSDDPREDPKNTIASQVTLIQTLNDFVRHGYHLSLSINDPSKECSISGSVSPIIQGILGRFHLDPEESGVSFTGPSCLPLTGSATLTVQHSIHGDLCDFQLLSLSPSAPLLLPVVTCRTPTNAANNRFLSGFHSQTLYAGYISYQIEPDYSPQNFPTVILQDTTGLTMDLVQFFESIDSSNLLIFVHGFNVPFDQAVETAARLKHGLDAKDPKEGSSIQRPACVILFSWPSADSLFDYRSDYEMNAPQAVESFLLFMNQILAFQDGQFRDKIVVAAHSMGNLLISLALKAFSEIYLSLKAVVCIAADIPTHALPLLAQHLDSNPPTHTNLDPKIFSISTPYDFALLASSSQHLNQRLGMFESVLSQFHMSISLSRARAYTFDAKMHSYFLADEVIGFLHTLLFHNTPQGLLQQHLIAQCDLRFPDTFQQNLEKIGDWSGPSQAAGWWQFPPVKKVDIPI